MSRNSLISSCTIFTFLLLLNAVWLQAQEIKEVPSYAENVNKFRQHEDSLKSIFDVIRTNPVENERFDACNNFIQYLVETLKIPNSFDYPFDSLVNISIVQPPNKAFRIFSWFVVRGNTLEDRRYRYYGAIQYNTGDALKLTPLMDKSGRIFKPTTKELSNEEWFGALYYGIHQYTHNDTTNYLLFGWDGNTEKSDVKLVDIMYIKDDKPVFGKPIFDVLTPENRELQNRMILEFKEGSIVSLNYNPDLQTIVYDFLTTEDEDAQKVGGSDFALVPDGTYQGMKLNNKGIWEAVPKVYNQVNETAPRPAPVLNSGSKKKKKKKKQKKKRRKKQK